MTKIFKFPIEPKETVQTMFLPQGAEIVALKIQMVPEVRTGGKFKSTNVHEGLFFWAIVDPAASAVPRRLMCVGTGWEIQPDIKEHIDTVISKGGYVWHLLEIK